MKEIVLEEIIRFKNRKFFRFPKIISQFILFILKKILKLNSINEFINKQNHVKGIDFIDEVFSFLNFSFYLTDRDIEKIPAIGKLIITANHPLGGLDGLALIKAVSRVRKDLKIVVNDVLMSFENLNEFFIPFDIFSRKTQKNSVYLIKKAIDEEKAVIFFPAAEVSRLKFSGIKDNHWHNGPVKFASQFNVPILPVFVKGRNSLLFYLISLLNKNLSTLLLPREIFKKKGKSIAIKIGNPIDSNKAFYHSSLSMKELSALLKKHVYRIGKNRKGIFKTYQTIVHPVPKTDLKKEFKKSLLLKKVDENIKIFLVDGNECPNIINEIGRLRELTFRSVGEGTWKKIDVDLFDTYYKQIVVWNDDNLDIMGAYRIGFCSELYAKYGISKIYTSSLFEYKSDFFPYLEQSIELGRSFIQEKFWKSNVLDYLWQGIGKAIEMTPGVKYLFGAVSISDYYSDTAKKMIVYYYSKWYKSNKIYAVSNHPLVLTKNELKDLKEMFDGNTKEKDYKTLKNSLKIQGFSIPILFKKYTDLCREGGTVFLDFGVDKDFSHTVDGLILLDLSMLKEKKKERYGISVNERNSLKNIMVKTV